MIQLSGNLSKTTLTVRQPLSLHRAWNLWPRPTPYVGSSLRLNGDVLHPKSSSTSVVVPLSCLAQASDQLFLSSNAQPTKGHLDCRSSYGFYNQHRRSVRLDGRSFHRSWAKPVRPSEMQTNLRLSSHSSLQHAVVVCEGQSARLPVEVST